MSFGPEYQKIHPLFDRKGNRIIAKTKNRDWTELQRLGLTAGGEVEWPGA